jgi:hypothetical protein
VEAFKRGYMTVSISSDLLQGQGLTLQSHDPTDFVLKEDQDAEWNTLHPYGRPTIPLATQKAIGLVSY